jgi:hypothetical protein
LARETEEVLRSATVIRRSRGQREKLIKRDNVVLVGTAPRGAMAMAKAAKSQLHA